MRETLLINNMTVLENNTIKMVGTILVNLKNGNAKDLENSFILMI